MQNIAHPSLLLPAALVAQIRACTTEAEKAKQLLPAQLAIIQQSNWFHLFVPEYYGGLNLSLPEVVQLEEALAWTDGSFGWVVTLCAGAAMFVGFMDPELAEDIFQTPDTCLAGSGQATGIAKETDNGFEISGSWPYASGAPHATHFTANCKLEKDGILITDESGDDVIQSFIFKRDEVVLQENWEYIGLNATAGYSYTVDAVKVPANRTFIINQQHAVLPAPIYHYPFLQMAECTLAANIAGMCIRFFDLAKDMLAAKQTTNQRAASVKEKGLELLQTTVAEMNQLRDAFYTALQHSWNVHIDTKKTDTEALEMVSLTSRNLANGTRVWVDKIFPYLGLDAARTHEPINQVWRNIHTASQHSLLIQ